jgi:hypothetical protein
MWRIELPAGRRLTPEELCQLADDLRQALHDPARVVRVAITFETHDGARMTCEHDERLARNHDEDDD